MIIIRQAIRVPRVLPLLIAGGLVISACSSTNAAGDPFLKGPSSITKSGAVQVLIEGDSLALTLGVGISGGQEAYGLHIIDDGDLGCGIASGDPIMLAGVQYTYTAGMPSPDPDQPPNCPDWKQIWTSNLVDSQPDVVMILVGRWEIVNRMHDGQWMNIGEPAYNSYIRSQLEAAVRLAGSQGARVVLLTMPYVAPQSAPDGTLYPETIPARVDQFNAIVRQVAAEHSNWVSVIDLNAMLDPAGKYTSQVGAVTTRNLVDANGVPDGTHISPAGGEMVAQKILPKLTKLGSLARQSG